MDGIARSGLGTQGYGYDSSSSVNELHSMDDGAARAPPGRAGFLPVMIPLIPRWPVRIECATPPDSPSIPRIRQPGRLFWGVRVGLVGLLWRPGAGKLIQRVVLNT